MSTLSFCGMTCGFGPPIIYTKHLLRNTTVSAWEPSVSHGNQKMAMGRRSAFLNLTLTQNYNVYMTRTAGLNGAVIVILSYILSEA